MRTVTMCFSVLQFSRTAIPRFTNIWRGSFHSFSTSCRTHTNFTVLCSNSLEGGYSSRRWIRRSVSTNTGQSTKKSTDFRHEVFEETVPATSSSTTDVKRAETNAFHKIEYFDIQQTIAVDKDLARPVTIIVFDIETTGLGREHERIIEIAFQDLGGGENSTFQTLVNPLREVRNADIHGITTHMVKQPEVPRMVELIPILLRYIRSRQKPGGCVLLIAHNARTFDVPFLIHEFKRHNFNIPQDWQFLDSIALARELKSKKPEGLELPPGLSLGVLREHYNIQLDGAAHRAMSDVKTLSSVVQKLTFDLKIQVPDLIERSFRATDLTNPSPKKKMKKKSSPK